MQTSTPNTFPLLLFKVLTPAQHQSKMKCQYIFTSFLSKKASRFQESRMSYTMRMNTSLQKTEYGGTAVSFQLKDTGEALSFWEDNSTFDACSTDLSGLTVMRQISLLEPCFAGHISEQWGRIKHGFSSIFHSDFKYSQARISLSCIMLKYFYYITQCLMWKEAPSMQQLPPWEKERQN